MGGSFQASKETKKVMEQDNKLRAKLKEMQKNKDLSEYKKKVKESKAKQVRAMYRSQKIEAIIWLLPPKDSFITQDRNDDFEGGQVESTFSWGHCDLTSGTILNK